MPNILIVLNKVSLQIEIKNKVSLPQAHSPVCYITELNYPFSHVNTEFKLSRLLSWSIPKWKIQHLWLVELGGDLFLGLLDWVFYYILPKPGCLLATPMFDRIGNIQPWLSHPLHYNEPYLGKKELIGHCLRIQIVTLSIQNLKSNGVYQDKSCDD